MNDADSNISAVPPSAMPQAQSGTVDAESGRIMTTLACRTCGYELRGLHADANCPECGAAISNSIGVDTLANANPTWLRKLALGCRIYAWAVIGTILAGAGIMVSSVIGGIAGAGSGGNVQMTAQVIGTMLITLMSVTALVGAWFVTEPDPSEPDTRQWNARSIARAGLIGNVLLSPWNMFAMTGGSWAGNLVGTAAYALIFISSGIIITLLATFGWAAYFLHLSRLLDRLPSRTLAAQAKVMMWGYPVATALTSLMGILALLFMQRATLTPGAMQPGTMPMGLMITGLGACVTGFFFFLFEVWGMILHFVLEFRLRAMLRTTAQSTATRE